MKITLLQCNVRDGDLSANAEKIISLIQGAASTDLFIAPAQAISGPFWRTDLSDKDFFASCREICQYMAAKLIDAPSLLCSLPYVSQGGILLAGGNITYVGTDFFTSSGIKISLYNSLSETQPSLPQSSDVIIDMNAHPFRPDSQKILEEKLCTLARRAGSFALSVNLAGGNGSHVFSGQSCMSNPLGYIAARAKAFTEDTLVIDLGSSQSYDQMLIGRIEPTYENNKEAQWEALVLGVRDFVRKAGCSKAIIGLSGGMDSALVACIAVEALGTENVIGILMPSPYSSEGSITDSLALAANLNMTTYTIPIEPIMASFCKSLQSVLDKLPPVENDLTLDNLQARIRGVLLMAIANRSGALVLNTGNKSELSMGYNTLYGDTVGALAVLGDIYKTRVYELAHWYCEHRGKMIIPENIFTKAPSAELRPDQKDTDSLPPYSELDKVLANLLDGESNDLSGLAVQIDDIRNKFLASAFKRRQCPPVLLVGSSR